MNERSLSIQQATKIYDALITTLGFLSALESRLARLGMRAETGYFEKVRAAREAYLLLMVETYCLAYPNHAQRSPRDAGWREPSRESETRAPFRRIERTTGVDDRT